MVKHVSSICLELDVSHKVVHLVQVIFGFYDPCNRPSSPGWPLLNYLAYICKRLGLEKVQFFCYRESRGFADLGLSLIGEALLEVAEGRVRNLICNSLSFTLFFYFLTLLKSCG